MKPAETSFQAAMVAALNAPGRATRVRRQNSGTVLKRDRQGRAYGVFRAGAPAGAADLVGLVAPDGLHLEIEVKVDEPQSLAQKRWAAFIDRFGGLYVLVRYDKGLSLERNVALAVALIDSAIAARMAAA